MRYPSKIISYLIYAVLFVVFFPLCLLAQSGGNKEVIKFDRLTGAATPEIPFDKEFVIEVDGDESLTMDSAQLYEIGVKGGQWSIKEPTDTNYHALIRKLSVRAGKEGKVLIDMPAIAPNRKFAILLFTPLKGKYLEKAITLIASMRNLPGGPQPQDFTPPMRDELHQIVIATQDESRYSTILDSIPLFYQFNCVPVKGVLTSIATSSTNGIVTLNRTDLYRIDSALLDRKINLDVMAVLNNVYAHHTEHDVYSGALPVDYEDVGDRADVFEVVSRLKNIDSSVAKYKSLFNAVNKLVITIPALSSTTEKLDSLIVQLVRYREQLNDDKKQLSVRLYESFWLTSSTKASNLETKGGSIFTLDAGIANIFARDNRNEWAFIPKLYWGVNIYFRPVDKNIERQSLPKRSSLSGPPRRFFSHQDILQHLCLTLGFTLGNMINGQFDNFYNNSSLLVGPSYRFARAYRFSLGAAVVRRVEDNPLKSAKPITLGAYASLSVDIDVLKFLDKVTGILFK